MSFERAARIIPDGEAVELEIPEDPVDALRRRARAFKTKYSPEWVQKNGSPWQEIDQALNRAGSDAEELFGDRSLRMLPEDGQRELAGYLSDMDAQSTRREWQATAKQIVGLFQRQISNPQ